MMPDLELILELPASGTIATIVPFLMLECLMLLMRATSLVHQQLFEDTRAKNVDPCVELMRSIYKRWKGAVLLLGLLYMHVFSSSGGMGKAALVQ